MIIRPLHPRACLGATIAVLGLLAACATPPPTPPRPAADTGLDRMERLTLAANRCWFKSKDPAFARYSLAPELSSFSGRPRFLLVPKNQPEARPLLVVEGQAGSADVSSFGPLLNTALGTRIGRDVRHWSTGATTCAAA